MTSPQAHDRHDMQPDVEQRVLTIAAEVFQTDAAQIDLSMGPDDIDRWDSLNHLRLITEIENTFSIRLTMAQIQQIQSLGDIVTFVCGSSS